MLEGPDRAWLLAGEATIALCAAFYLVTGVLLGGLYGVSFHLDPATAGPLAYAMHGGSVACFALTAGVVALISAVTVGGLTGRRPWALFVALALAGLYALTGLIPAAIVVVVAVMREPTRRAFGY